MRRESKIIYTDILADRDREDNIIKYQRLLGSAFYNYSMIKLSLNYFTGLEMSDEYENPYIEEVGRLLKDTVLSGKVPDAEQLGRLNELRAEITSKMKILTCYTDALEIYEYVLNRREADILGTEVGDTDVEALSDAMFRFVFSDQDKLLINARIKDFVAQLPVRITKQRFLDIVANSLSIYKGGEQESLNDFAETIKDAAVINTPEGFDTEYPELYETYLAISEADYSSLSEDDYNKLTLGLSKCTEFIEEEVTLYMMVMEVINDALILMNTSGIRDEKYLTGEAETAIKILDSLAGCEDIYKAAEGIDELLPSLEGAQESSYEELTIIEANLDELITSYSDEFAENETITDNFQKLRKSDVLTSTSLFMDIDRDFSVINNVADDAYVEKTREEVCNALSEALKGKSKYVKRSIMAKVMSTMPVFFNSQDEIKEYFLSALQSCGDNSELKACENLINEMMLQI